MIFEHVKKFIHNIFAMLGLGESDFHFEYGLHLNIIVNFVCV